MTRLGSICLAIFLLSRITVAAIPAQSISSAFSVTDLSADRVSLEIDCDRIDILNINATERETGAYSRLETGIAQYHGLPDLPKISRYILLPAQETATFKFEVLESEYTTLYSSTSILKTQHNSDTLIPPQPVALSNPGVIRGVRVALLSVYPVQYDAINDKFIYNRRIKVEIEFNEDDSLPEILPATHRRNRSLHFTRLMEALSLNSDDILRDRDIYNRDWIGHYLVVAREECLPYAIPLIEWKRASGHRVDILSYNAEEANSGDSPESIKADIQDLYDSYLADGIDPFEFILILGDRATNIGQAPWVLEAPYGLPSQGVTNHADYMYGLLERDDPEVEDYFADVGVGRFGSGNRDMMEIAVARTLAYEKEPWLEDTGWFTRGGVYSQTWGGDWNESIPYTVRWAEEVLKRLGYDEINIQEATRDNEDIAGNIIGPVLARWFNDQVGLMVGRAENFYWRNSFQGVEPNTVFPIGINTTGHGEFTLQHMFRTGNVDGLRGPSAFITGWGNPTTLYNNGMWLGIVKGALIHDLPLGLARTLGGIFMPILFDDPADSVMRQYQTDTDLYGDPGLQPWNGVPQLLSIELPAQISPSTSYLDVDVEDAGDGTAVEGVVVTLYAPGEMPEPEDYAGWYPEFMLVSVTDRTGKAEFVIDDPPPLGEMQVTVTGRHVYPLTETIDIAAQSIFVTVSGHSLEAGDDEILTPGEAGRISLTAKNTGIDDTARNVVAVVSSSSPFVEIEDNEIHFGDIEPDGESEGDNDVGITVHSSSPDMSKLELYVDFSSGDFNWRSAITLEVHAPDLVFDFNNSGFVQHGQTGGVELYFANNGRIDSGPLSVQIYSPGWAITVIDDTTEIDNIASGGSVLILNDAFRMESDSQAIPGMTAPLLAIFRGENEWIDTVNFDIQIGINGENNPQGPDDYGYICFDHTDTDWDLAPDYRWVEISLEDDDREVNGIEIDGFDNINDASVVIPLPFTLQFYGEEYDSVTVCINGFIAVGSQPRMVNYQNYPVDLGMGAGMGVIAPFWDNLVLSGTSSIYYYYLEEDGIFIIEWYEVSGLHYNNQQMRFEVIFRDTSEWPTSTGDNQILILYYEASEERGDIRDMPYLSVGISSPDGKTGLSYRFRGEGPITSVPLDRRMALLYTTLPDVHQAVVDDVQTPQEWTLRPNYPNPFNAVTTIEYSLKQPGITSLQVFNIKGILLSEIVEGFHTAGNYRVTFNAADIPSGVYIYRLRTPSAVMSRKMVLVK